MLANSVPDPEPRWPALVAMMAVGALYFALPESLRVGPDWLVLALVLVLTTPAIISHRYKKYLMSQVLGYAASGVVTLALIASLVLLVRRLPTHKETPGQ